MHAGWKADSIILPAGLGSMLFGRRNKGFIDLIWTRWILPGRRPEGRPLGDGKRWRLEYGSRPRAMANFFGLFWVVVVGAFVAASWGDREEIVGWLAFFTLPIIGALWSLADVHVARVEVDDAGIHFHYPWRPTAHVGWDQIERVTYNETMRWFVIRRRRGLRLRLSAARDGPGRLRSHLRRHVEPIRWATVATRLPRLADEE